MNDGLRQRILAGGQHAVGQLVQRPNLLQEPPLGRLTAAQLPEQVERLVLIFSAQACCSKVWNNCET